MAVLRVLGNPRRLIQLGPETGVTTGAVVSCVLVPPALSAMLIDRSVVNPPVAAANIAGRNVAEPSTAGIVRGCCCRSMFVAPRSEAAKAVVERKANPKAIVVNGICFILPGPPKLA
jgi:hypothetical protein